MARIYERLFCGNRPVYLWRTRGMRRWYWHRRRNRNEVLRQRAYRLNAQNDPAEIERLVAVGMEVVHNVLADLDADRGTAGG